jgi:prenyltransferase beta subunit
MTLTNESDFLGHQNFYLEQKTIKFTKFTLLCKTKKNCDFRRNITKSQNKFQLVLCRIILSFINYQNFTNIYSIMCIKLKSFFSISAVDRAIKI